VNILYVVHQFYPRFSSGTERFVLNVALGLQRDGHSAEVLTYDLFNPDPFPSRDQLSVRKYSYKHIPVVAVRHRKMPIDVHTSCEDPEIYRFALTFLRENKNYDLLHCAHPMRLTSFVRAARQLRLPYILTLTDFWLMCPKIFLQTTGGGLCAGPEGGQVCSRLCPELDSNFVRDRLEHAKEILSGAKAIISPSQFLAALFKKEFPELKLSLIHHGIDTGSLRQNTRTYKNGDRVVFGYTGGLAPHKGVHLLVQAFRKMPAANARLKLYGSYSHEMEYAQKLFKIAEGDHRIEFCGTYEPASVGAILQGLDILVIPSVVYESYSLSLHEALACNVPVITSNIGAALEEITDSKNGFTFTVGDECALKNKMESIARNPEILNEIKQSLERYIPMLVEEEAYLYERLYSMAEGLKPQGAL
jgi:glycosyltransferase involved in cell wall biosynthesis